MPSNSLKKLTAIQSARLSEIEFIRSRLRVRPRDSLSKNVVQSRIDAIKTVWDETRKTHAEIIGRVDAASDIYIIEGVFARMQTIYEDALDEFLSLLSDFERRNENELRSRVDEQNASDVNPRPAKLPKLDLPTFSGHYEDWESFHDLFVSLVHNAPRLSDVTKLQYLKSCLKGTAADLVRDIATTNANYISTWKSLKARFYNLRLTVYNHLNTLMNLASLKRESSIELRKFADECQRIVRALKNLKMPVENWDIWLVYILGNKLDSDTRKLWESELSSKDKNKAGNVDDDCIIFDSFPKFSELAEFLEKRVQALTMVSDSKNEKRASLFQKTLITNSRKTFFTISKKNAVNDIKCSLCAGNHKIMKCAQFRAKSAYDRGAHIRRLQLCFNCFGPHKFRDCSSPKRCVTCSGKHHSLLHFNTKSRNQLNETNSDHDNKLDTIKNTERSSGVNAHTASVTRPYNSVLLATAQVIIIGPNGKQTFARALLDQGSEISFVTESIAQLLGLKKHHVNIPLTGLGANTTGTARALVNFTLQSITDSNFSLEIEALTLPRLTSKLPARKTIELDMSYLQNFSLADPKFNIPDKIDIILGADVYGKVLKSGLHTFSTVIAQNTELGWILSGPVQASASRRAELSYQAPKLVMHCISNDELNIELQKFWNLEEVGSVTSRSKPEEEFCEQKFVKTHTRSPDGRYTVRLPLKSDIPQVANETRHMAIKSLAQTHRRFSRDGRLSRAYKEFMDTYERLGHMTPIPKNEINNRNGWYLPHHAVVQESAGKYKIRVVFDASRRTSNNNFLNNFLSVGPALQRDLSLILLNWRKYRYVFTADIIKMYRQIRVHSEDQDFQRIVWAPHPNDIPRDYRLNTVTYGTSCAPYLAIRTLLQLANDERNVYPLGARCLEQNTYVDDMFAGADKLSVAIEKRDELVNILNSAGIQLDKWAANNDALLPLQFRNVNNNISKEINENESVKTLGLKWNPEKDVFSFELKHLNLTSAPTKRSVLSTIARLYDPLGWLSPIIISAKIIMQDLWLSKCDWDSILPKEIRDKWIEYCKSLAEPNIISIDRWLHTESNCSAQIHGFADASSRAYAAVVYIRVKKGDRTHISLLASKSKVAPVKTISIPNLELCGAALLVKLIKHVKRLEFFATMPVTAWCDSQIVLAWLQKHPCHWKSFVANRVSLIQTELPSATWRYISTKENPADLATRGCTPAKLADNDLWWHGPTWLSQPGENFPKLPTPV